ncbi:MAG: hypothetical protein KC503_21745 [Myxococcales bacterium]|nr:hypothetical protein [Myxococcales bacterium]
MEPPSPDVHLRLEVDRNLALVSEQLVRGVIEGGLVGAAQRITRRDGSRLAFERSGPGTLDRGELRLERTEAGQTTIDVQLWCGGLKRQSSAVGAAGALASGLPLAALLGWPFVAVGLPVGVAMAIWRYRSVRARYAAQVSTYVDNISYLKAL